jgi:hypothetical protein
VQRKIVEELCRMSRPHPDVPDQAAGRAALEDLKREAMGSKILVDPEKAAADARRAAGQRKVVATEQRRARIGELRTAFIALNQHTPATEGHYKRKVLTTQCPLKRSKYCADGLTRSQPRCSRSTDHVLREHTFIASSGIS